MAVPAVYIERSEWTVAARGEVLQRVGFEVQMDLYGDFEWNRSTVDSIIGEQDSWITLSWDTNVVRIQPYSDDEYPVSMPAAIANCGFRVVEDGGDAIALDMTHLYVQEEARRQGYGQLMWDCYLAVAVYGGLELRGGVGSTERGGTVRFLRSQGVPEDDINPGLKAGGSGLTTWSTALSNVAPQAPVRKTTVEV